MFSRILVVTDLSKASNAMLPCLSVLRGLGSTEAVLLHSVNARTVSGLSDEALSDLTEQLQQQCRLLASMGFKPDYELTTGLTQLQLNAVARRRGSTIAVVGSHGEGLFGEKPLGGIVGAVIQGARLPVLIIQIQMQNSGSRVCRVAPGGLLSHVIHATDFSDNAERAFSQVEKLARGGALRITLVHVQEPSSMAHLTPQELKELDRVDRIRLNRLRERALQAGRAPAHCTVLHGAPAQEIISYATDTKASLIVIGNQGRGYIGELFLGSVSREVARNAPCSVLLVPNPL